jgi:hypothetical protein
MFEVFCDVKLRRWVMVPDTCQDSVPSPSRVKSWDHLKGRKTRSFETSGTTISVIVQNNYIVNNTSIITSTVAPSWKTPTSFCSMPDVVTYAGILHSILILTTDYHLWFEHFGNILRVLFNTLRVMYIYVLLMLFPSDKITLLIVIIHFSQIYRSLFHIAEAKTTNI